MHLLLTYSASLLALISLSIGSDAKADQTLSPVATKEFHERNAEQQIWSDENFEDLLTALADLDDHGLDSAHYHLQELHSLAGEREKRDRLATDAWFSAAAHMVYGKLDAVSIEPDWTAARRDADLAGILRNALSNGAVAQSLDSLAPKQPGYRNLKAELAQLRELDAEGITRVPSGAPLRKGDRGPRVTALIERLVELALIGDDDAGDVFDDSVNAAVIVFQDSNDLDADGIVGPATIAALNRGQEEKISQLRVNMERWRWLPDDLGKRHIRVNIAAFSLTLWENGEPGKTHLTIVGKTYRKTPVFSDIIEYIVFNPWWETPQSIARKDKLPAFRKDPESVTRLGFQVLDHSGATVNAGSINWNTVSATNFPYRLRQAPGPQNALGQVKVMFPNKHNVYIHDTPTRGLFSQRQRAFSSGCLRTHNPIDLSEWLLRDTLGWDRKRIDAVLGTNNETRANLAATVPVHVLYSTAVAESGGLVRYLDDIYERDDAVLAGLNAPPVSNSE